MKDEKELVHNKKEEIVEKLKKRKRGYGAGTRKPINNQIDRRG